MRISTGSLTALLDILSLAPQATGRPVHSMAPEELGRFVEGLTTPGSRAKPVGSMPSDELAAALKDLWGSAGDGNTLLPALTAPVPPLPDELLEPLGEGALVMPAADAPLFPRSDDLTPAELNAAQEALYVRFVAADEEELAIRRTDRSQEVPGEGWEGLGGDEGNGSSRRRRAAPATPLDVPERARSAALLIDEVVGAADEQAWRSALRGEETQWRGRRGEETQWRRKERRRRERRLEATWQGEDGSRVGALSEWSDVGGPGEFALLPLAAAGASMPPLLSAVQLREAQAMQQMLMPVAAVFQVAEDRTEVGEMEEAETVAAQREVELKVLDIGEAGGGAGGAGAFFTLAEPPAVSDNVLQPYALPTVYLPPAALLVEAGSIPVVEMADVTVVELSDAGSEGAVSLEGLAALDTGLLAPGLTPGLMGEESALAGGGVATPSLVMWREEMEALPDAILRPRTYAEVAGELRVGWQAASPPPLSNAPGDVEESRASWQTDDALLPAREEELWMGWQAPPPPPPTPPLFALLPELILDSSPPPPVALDPVLWTSESSPAALDPVPWTSEPSPLALPASPASRASPASPASPASRASRASPTPRRQEARPLSPLMGLLLGADGLLDLEGLSLASMPTMSVTGSFAGGGVAGGGVAGGGFAGGGITGGGFAGGGFAGGGFAGGGFAGGGFAGDGFTGGGFAGDGFTGGGFAGGGFTGGGFAGGGFAGGGFAPFVMGEVLDDLSSNRHTRNPVMYSIARPPSIC